MVQREDNHIERERNDADTHSKMFLGGLSPNTTEDSIKEFYRQFGEVLNVVILRDQATNRSRGFGFITFNEASSVDQAQSARPHVVDGRSIDSKRALPRPEPTKSAPNTSGRKIFIGGLKDVHDEHVLRQHFQQFGNIIGVKVITDRNTGRQRGFAYVEFEDYDAADKAVLQKYHSIQSVTVDVKKSNYKQEQAKKIGNHDGNTSNVTSPSTSGNYPPSSYPPPAYPYGYPQYCGWGLPPATYSVQQPTTSAGQASFYEAQPAWNGWCYGTQQTQTKNDWNDSSDSQNFGNYPQQSYNGGPQKENKLQNSRSNPYST